MPAALRLPPILLNLITLGRAVELGRYPTLFCMLGNVAGLAVPGVVTGFGLVALLATSPRIRVVFQRLSMGFLIFLCVQMMLSNQPRSRTLSNANTPPMGFYHAAPVSPIQL